MNKVLFTAQGWELHKMSEIYEVRDGTHDSPKYQETGYPLLTSKNLKEDGISLEKVQYISVEDYEKINRRSKVSQGDLLFAMIGTIGNPTIVKTNPNFAIKNVALFKGNNNQNIKFLFYYLKTNFVRQKNESRNKRNNTKVCKFKLSENFSNSGSAD